MDPLAVPVATFEKYESPLNDACDAKSFAEAIMDHVEKIFLKVGNLQPTAILLHGDQATVIALTFENTEQKDLVSGFVRDMSSELGAHAVGFAAESWLASIKEEDKDKALDVIPSEHPDKKEVIFVTATWKDVFGKGSAARATYIKRDEEEKVIELVRNDKELDDGTCQGRFMF